MTDQPAAPATRLVEIKHRWNGAVLFTIEVAADDPQPLRTALVKAVASRANLAGANLAGANLAGANLARANLAGANLAGANLARANLAGANLDGAYLAGANLAGANLAGANLARANLARANLAGANLAGANLARANLAGANLAGANLAGANLAGANLAGANLARANLAGANLDGAYLDGAYLAGANLDGANLAGANLARANLAGANLAGANLAGANLDGAYLAGANLDGANLDGGGEMLVGARSALTVGPIGSSEETLAFFRTDKGLRVRGADVKGDEETLVKWIAEQLDETDGKVYRAALELAKLALPPATEEEIASAKERAAAAPKAITIEAEDLAKYLPGEPKPGCSEWLTCYCSAELRGKIWMAKRDALAKEAAPAQAAE